MKRIGILLSLFVCVLPAYNQKYVTAGGLRFSNEGFGLSLQQKIFEHTTIEVIALGNFTEVSISGLIEKHNNLLFSKNLNVYMGVGPVFGNYLNDESTKSNYIGSDVIVGLEYKILFLPIVVSADVKPRFKLEQDDWINFATGISFRYVFIKEKRTLFKEKGRRRK